MASRQIRGLLAASLGNALEFYDFTVYAYFAIQIGKAFFPSGNPQASLLASLAVFGAGFVTRPLGALVIGRYGDRAGRGPAMVLSMMLMGAAILLLVGCPGYARIGLAAPCVVVLARLLQGFALGGEVGPATAYMFECAPERHRGLFASAQRATQLFSGLVGSLVGTVLATILPAPVFEDWGWRIALGLGALIVPYGLMLRRTLPNPAEDTAAGHQAERPPAIVPVRAVGRLLTAAMLVATGATISAYVLIYMATFGQATLHLSAGASLAGQSMANLAAVLAILGSAAASDRIGRRPLLIGGSLAAAVLVPPTFAWVLAHPTPATFMTANAIIAVLFAVPNAVIFAAVAEGLPRRMRSLAIALSYTLPVTLFGGSTQFVVTWLIGWSGSPMAVAWYASAALGLSLVGAVLIRESAPAVLARRGALVGAGLA